MFSGLPPKVDTPLTLRHVCLVSSAGKTSPSGYTGGSCSFTFACADEASGPHLAAPRHSKWERHEPLPAPICTGCAALPVVSWIAQAQTYPSRPVRVIVGFAAGGSADIIARLMGQWLSERLGQQFIIENRPGAGTNIATAAVAEATPDGYTLLLVTAANFINATLYENLN